MMTVAYYGFCHSFVGHLLLTDACVAHCKICATRECASKLTVINATAWECPSHSSMQLMRHGSSLCLTQHISSRSYWKLNLLHGDRLYNHNQFYVHSYFCRDCRNRNIFVRVWWVHSSHSKFMSLQWHNRNVSCSVGDCVTSRPAPFSGRCL